MSGKLYVGNIPWTSTEDEIRKHFEPYGQIHRVSIIKDRQTGRPRGFCFVEMDNAEAAVEQLNQKELNGRPLKIDIAKERV